MEFSTTEIVGYLASIGILISFLMKEMKTLRIINSLGCAMFVWYGILLDYSLPIIITNMAILGINIFYLLRMPK